MNTVTPTVLRRTCAKVSAPWFAVMALLAAMTMILAPSAAALTTSSVPATTYDSRAHAYDSRPRGAHPNSTSDVRVAPAPTLVISSGAGSSSLSTLSVAAKSDPLVDFAHANRTADSRFASECTSESGAKYYDTNLRGGRANPYDHHGGCAEIGCLLQA